MASRPGEFELIASLFRPLATSPDALGLADDAAVIRPRPGYDTVVTTDALVAGVHFRERDEASTVAARCLNTNLSDLAAMGAEPHGYTLALALADDWSLDWVGEFAATLSKLQTKWRTLPRLQIWQKVNF